MFSIYWLFYEKGKKSQFLKRRSFERNYFLAIKWLNFYPIFDNFMKLLNNVLLLLIVREAFSSDDKEIQFSLGWKQLQLFLSIKGITGKEITQKLFCANTQTSLKINIYNFFCFVECLKVCKWILSFSIYKYVFFYFWNKMIGSSAVSNWTILFSTFSWQSFFFVDVLQGQKALMRLETYSQFWQSKILENHCFYCR